MSKTVERFQNPCAGDTVNLRLFSYNGNNLSDFYSVEKVEIYFLDPNEITDTNPEGRRLVQTFTSGAITSEETGKYLLTVELEELRYVIGQYVDVWTVKPTETEPEHAVEQTFQVYPSLWYTTSVPVVYNFKIQFQPNRLRKGSKQYIIAEIIPNVPTAGDLRKYYENLAIVSDLKISLEMQCGECLPAESDLRLILDEVSVDYREKRFGYYQLDTTDMDCGIYDIWFRLDFGGNTYISDRNQFQIYD